MVDVVETICHFNSGRDPEPLALKYRNLRASPFVFLRGTCHLFYDSLPNERLFRRAPLVWSCGDLHLENFGSYKGDNRLVYFDINDFDEATLAPATWDIVRLLTSVLVAADTLHATPAEALRLCKAFVQAYADALTSGKARWIERETAQGLVRQLLEALKGRTRVEFLDRRTERKRRRRVIACDGRHALPASDAQRSGVTDLIDEFASEQANPGFFKVLDVARRIAGTGSLGVERYAILVEGKGSPDGNYLLDLKQALPSSLEPHLKIEQPKWPSPAHRVVALQRRMQAISMAFLHPIASRKSSYVLRGLQPSEDRVALDATRTQLAHIEGVLQEMGRMVAWAQLRSSGQQGSAIADALIDFGASRRKWQQELYEASQQCARQVSKDWQTYVAAYDAGALPG
jgi:uncharacterized protein (DUF2252 family)